MTAEPSTVVDDHGPGRLVLRGGLLADGRRADIAVDTSRGRIAAVGVVEARPADGSQHRTVLRQGRIVARTTTHHELLG